MFHLLIFLISLVYSGVGNPSGSCVPIRKEIKQVERTMGEGLSIQQVPVPDYDNREIQAYYQGDCIHMIKRDGKLLGYRISSRAVGRQEFFDYSVIFSPEVVVLDVQVINYRSTHGYGIVNKKWLSQFKGFSGQDWKLGKDIDAVSGSTISAESLVKDIIRSYHLVSIIVNHRSAIDSGIKK